MEFFWMGVFLFQSLPLPNDHQNFQEAWQLGGKAAQPYRKERRQRKRLYHGIQEGGLV